jgi:hypothetical protein
MTSDTSFQVIQDGLLHTDEVKAGGGMMSVFQAIKQLLLRYY